MDRAYRRVVTIMGSGFIGILIAAILQIMYDQGMLVDTVVSQQTPLHQIMAVVIAIFLLLGVIIAAAD